MTTSSNGNGVEDDDNILEGTLALIKPDAVDRAKEIINIIISEGFLIVEKKRFQFSREVRHTTVGNDCAGGPCFSRLRLFTSNLIGPFPCFM